MSPVLLVHGFKDDSRKMRHLARHLEARGWAPQACNLGPNRGEVGMEVLAEQLAAFVESHLSGVKRFDLVGFSMGGLISRYYLQRLNGLGRVRRFVTISTPHRGTAAAYLVDNPGCRQMRPGSPFLADLARDAARLKTVGFTSIWTPLDAIILPPQSSVLPEARTQCVWSLAHPLMVREQRVLRAVEKALGDGDGLIPG